MLEKLAPYRKGLWATVGLVAAWGVTASADGHFAQSELWGLLVVLTGAGKVVHVKNAPRRRS